MQANVRTNDLLNASDFVKSDRTELTSEASQQSHAAPAQTGCWAALVGEQYYTKKQQLILDEQILLRVIDFNIVAEHPHKYLLNFARTIKASCELVQLAICVLNDSFVHTSLSISCSAPEIAAGALLLASQILNDVADLPHCWWQAVGVSTRQATSVGHTMLDALN